ncbi:TetR family transcriptional regulator [Tamaricihabitans halophyticus]|uniref:TetR family transcriptional regulator n=1 Tax=Tamaricihabitans halophyticus TaxID=1262583 RepID=A0A4R2R623_9PSEU|nr:TetR/AcrR family transcriptional regulator C-terminal domain-containing protein [Tamaricihabitans halophyticus]TCP57258.1 TetR family transcriptional regulator [Tamaricihabitans halophyticus]
MPRPRSLTTDTIAAAAIAVLDRDGYTALSMRTVARELNMSTMALYRYLADRDDLERLIVDYVWAPVDVKVPANRSWDEQIALLVGRVRTAAKAHPEAVPLLLRHRQASARSVAWIETMLGVLADAGFSGNARVIAQRTIVNYLVGAIQSEHLSALDGAGTAALAALPRDEFPQLRETARIASRLTPDTEFRRGLAIVLNGLGVPD